MGTFVGTSIGLIAASVLVAGCDPLKRGAVRTNGAVEGADSAVNVEEAPQAPPDPDARDAEAAPFDGIPGRLIELGVPRPAVPDPRREPPACSMRYPLCVHRGSDATPALTLAALAAAERAWAALTGPLAFLPPDADPSTRAYDLYLAGSDDAIAIGDGTYLAERDARSSMDRASAFSVVSSRIAAGCALDAAVARAVARAALYRVAPGTDEGSALAQTSYLAALVAPCAPSLDEGIADFQSAPESTPVDTHPELPPGLAVSIARGARLLPAWLDETYGSEPGAIVRALWALAPTQTKLGAPRWNSEPDGFDVMRVTFRGTLSMAEGLDELFTGFAVARAFEPASAPVRVDWDLPWPVKAKRVAASVGVAPLGSAYVRIHDVPAHARLRIEATWEEHAKMRFTAVKLDASGNKIGQIPITGLPRTTEAQRTIADLDGVASVLIVAMNAGDSSFGFDPDDVAWEPHGYLLTIAAE